jgi:hypothetical protein
MIAERSSHSSGHCEWSEGASGERSRQSKRLLALQREDSGWGQWPGADKRRLLALAYTLE